METAMTTMVTTIEIMMTDMAIVDERMSNTTHHLLPMIAVVVAVVAINIMKMIIMKEMQEVVVVEGGEGETKMDIMTTREGIKVEGTMMVRHR
jgi:hypothetical protein